MVFVGKNFKAILCSKRLIILNIYGSRTDSDIYRPQACYSQRDCDKNEQCLKWSSDHPSGICYKPQCKKSRECPPAFGCSEMGLCIQNFCTSSKECGARYICLQGSCVLNGCKNDFECGSKHVCHQCQDCDKG